MKKGNIIVLDIGTTTAKTTVFDLKGNTLAFDSVPYGFLEKPSGFFEQDPEEVLSAIYGGAKGAIEAARKKSLDFDPIVISIVCQGGSVIPCTVDGDPVYPMITWMDNRAKDLVQKIDREPFGDVIKAKTGRRLQAGLPLAMILWMRENEPEIFAKAKRWPCLNDFVINKLVGSSITDPSAAGLSQLYNVRDNTWDEELLRYAGLDLSAVSKCLPSGALCGSLLDAPAKAMGLPAGIPGLNSMHDRTSEAVGLGSFHPGDSWIGTGTAWVICSILEDKEENSGLETNYHALPGLKIASNLVGGIGTSVEWWIPELMKRRNLPDRKSALKEMTLLAKESPAGANGVFFRAFTGKGNEGTFQNVKDSNTDADFCRAVYESIVFDFKKTYENFTSKAPVKGSLTLVGGAARSSYWPTIISEILGVPIKVSTYEHDVTLGAAILGGVYLGLGDNVEEVFDLFKTGRRNVTPDSEKSLLYEEIYRKYSIM